MKRLRILMIVMATAMAMTLLLASLVLASDGDEGASTPVDPEPVQSERGEKGSDVKSVEAESTAAPVAMLGTGGPDAFGYTYADSAEPSCKTTFTDISAVGTALGLNDEDEANVTLPFPFTFYGVTSTNIRVGNNGGIIFNDTGSSLNFTNDPLPTTDTGLATTGGMLALWDDLGSAGDVFTATTGTSPNRQFIVQWNQIPRFSSIGDTTFQIVFYEGTNKVDFVYQDVDFGNATYDMGASATVGIQQDSTNALQYSFNSAVITDGLSICYTPPTPPSIVLEKTVGTGASCATTDEIDVDSGTAVNYCFVVTNVSTTTFDTHSLDDDQLGNIFSISGFPIAPGTSFTLPVPATINTTTVNIATWTASVGGTNVVSSTDTATVNVIRDIDLQKTVGTDLASCATTDTIIVSSGTTVNYCYTVTNNGSVVYQLHDLVDSELGTLLSGAAVTLSPGDVYTYTAATTIMATTVNTATWTAYKAGPTDETMATDTATVLVPAAEPVTCGGPTVSFDAGIPLDWSVKTNAISTTNVIWTDGVSCGESGNFTGGSGLAACASSDLQAGGGGLYDTELQTSLIDLTGFAGPQLSYFVNYQNFAGGDFLDVDVSNDGGATWTTVLSWNEDHGSFRGATGELVTIDLSAYSGQQILVRWHYYDPVGGVTSLDWYAQIDDVSLACVAGPAVDLNVTVGSDASSCATTDTLSVPEGSDVTYCFEVTNTGVVTLTQHDLADSEFGAILSGFSLSLAPGASTFVTQTAMVTATTVNTATWTAYNPGPADLVMSTDSATVNTYSVASYPTCADFETGTLPSYMYTEVTVNGTSTGQVAVTTNFPQAGSYGIDIDTDCGGVACSPSTQQAFIMAIDLAGQTNIELNFWGIDHGDETNPEDGIFISDDGGATWALIFDLNPLTTSYTNEIIDLDAAVATAGMSFVDGFLIKFQSLDNFDLSLDGFSFDNICVQPQAPNISVAPSNISETIFTDDMVTNTVTIDNLGSLDLNWSINEAVDDTSCDSPSDLTWVSVMPVMGTTSASSSNSVSVVFDSTGFATGTYTGTLCVDSDDPDEPRITVPLTMVVAQRFPDIDVNPTSVAVTSFSNVVTTRSLTIDNLGSLDLNWTANEAVNDTSCDSPSDLSWVAVSPTSGTTAEAGSSVVSVVFDSTGLATGTYTGTLCIDSDDPDEARITVPLSLVVGAPAAYPTCADFETGTLPSYMYTEVTTNDTSIGRVQVTSAYTQTGSYAIDIDTDCGSVACSTLDTQQAFIMGIDLAGQSNVELNFWVHEHSDENEPEDGVFISDDGGATWALAFSFNGLPSSYVNQVISLDAAASAAGMSLVDGFLIKFQSLDEYDIPTDGYSFDDICVQAGTPDIDVTPLIISDTVPTNGMVTNTLMVDNVGSAGLNWIINEAINDTSCATPSDLSWVSVSPTSGTTLGGNSSSVDVVFDSTGLAIGTYTGTLCVISDDPDEPLITVPLTMNVEARSPDIDVNPTSVSATSFADRMTTRLLTVDNLGTADLNWVASEAVDDTSCATPSDLSWVAVSPTSGTTASGGSSTVNVVFDSTGLATGTYTGTLCVISDDPDEPLTTVSLMLSVVARPVIPPDSYGYTVDTSCTTGFTDISGLGTALGLTDDGETNVTMPFPFIFYGVSSTDLRVGNNGGILFNDTGTTNLSTVNDPLPTTDAGLATNGGILPFWDDIDSDTGDVYYATVGTAPNRRFIVQWHQRPRFSNIGSSTFQVVLYEGVNTIDFVYQDVDFGNATYDYGASATVGIQQNSSNALQYSNDTALVFDGQAICFAPPAPEIDVDPIAMTQTMAANTMMTQTLTISNTGVGDLFWDIAEAATVADCNSPSDLGWVSVAPNSGTTAASGVSSVDVVFDSTGLASGTYNGALCINNNDADERPFVVPVTLTVTGCAAPDAPASVTITVTGADVTLTWADTGDVNYQVWWSTTNPYFIPGDAGTSSSTVTGPTTMWTGVGDAGDPATNYYYTVANSCGEAGATGTLDRQAEFDFGIIPGTP